MTLSILKYQNQQDFQVVIKEFSIYTSSNKKHLIVNVSEKRKFEDIINSWLLSDGYTNKLVGIHSFSVLGFRLQDSLDHVLYIKDKCKKTSKIGDHQVVVCEFDFSDNSKLVGTYLGGKFAQLEIVATNSLRVDEQKKVIKTLTKELKLDKNFLQDKHLKWDYKASVFIYNPNAFVFENVLLENFIELNQLANNPSSKVIFSMISEATLKLIKDIESY
jgi:hypothetical protein